MYEVWKWTLDDACLEEWAHMPAYKRQEAIWMAAYKRQETARMAAYVCQPDICPPGGLRPGGCLSLTPH